MNSDKANSNESKKTPAKKLAKDVQKKAGRAGIDESTDRTTGADRTDQRKTSWKGQRPEEEGEI